MWFMQPRNVRDVGGQTLNCRWSRGSNRGWGKSGVPSVVCFFSRDSLQPLGEATGAAASHTHTHTRAHAHACTHAHYTHALTTHAPHTHATTTTRARMHYAHHTHTRARAATQKLTYPTRANHCDAHTNITRTHSVPRPTCIFGFRPGVYDKESAVQSPVHFIASCTTHPAPTPTPPPIQHISFVAGYLGCFGLHFCLSPLALPSNYLLSLLSPFYR